MSAIVHRHLVSSLALACGLLSAPTASAQALTGSADTKTISRAELLDRIHGGWAGMLIGGLEGLPHEFKYREQPRDALPAPPIGFGVAVFIDEVCNSVCDHVGHASLDIARNILWQQRDFQLRIPPRGAAIRSEIAAQDP
jgi:hypothetical protein